MFIPNYVTKALVDTDSVLLNPAQIAYLHINKVKTRVIIMQNGSREVHNEIFMDETNRASHYWLWIAMPKKNYHTMKEDFKQLSAGTRLETIGELKEWLEARLKDETINLNTRLKSPVNQEVDNTINNHFMYVQIVDYNIIYINKDIHPSKFKV